MTTALLISTYNWPEALHLVFKSILNQSDLPDEVLIADDGSAEKTKLLIEEFKKNCPIPVKHFWQEDKGFRKSKILNKAIAGSESDYIIQVDGDCILHTKFVKDHKRFALRGAYLYGSRVNIVPNFVLKVFQKEQISFNIFSKEIKNRTRSLAVPILSNLYLAHEGISKKFRGCNVSYWVDDFIAVNGYNEDYEGWGREDSDLVIRMGNKGVKAKRLRYAGIVFHIHHKVNSKENLELNDSLQNDTISKKTVAIVNGVNQYLK